MMVLVLEYKDGDIVAEEVRTVKRSEGEILFNRAKYYPGEDHDVEEDMLKSAYIIKSGIKIPLYNEVEESSKSRF